MPLTVTPNLQFSETYIEDTYSGLNPRTEDYISSVVASLKTEYLFHHGHLDADFLFGNTYSTAPAQANRLTGEQSGTLDYLYEGRRWRSGIKGSMISTRYGETVTQFNEGILTHSTEFRHESIGVYGKYFSVRSWDLSVSYDRINNRYNSDQYVNSESHSASASLAYHLSSLDQLDFMGGADDYRFKPGPEIKSATSNIQWNHKQGELTVIQAGTGLGVTTGRSIFWLSNISLTRNFEGGSAQAGYSRNLGTGGGLTDSAVVTQDFTAVASRKFWQAVNGNISGNTGDSIGISPGSNFHMKFWNISASLNYLVLRWLNSTLSYSHYYQKVNESSSESLHSNQILFVLSTNLLPLRPFK